MQTEPYSPFILIIYFVNLDVVIVFVRTEYTAQFCKIVRSVFILPLPRTDIFTRMLNV
jgi:hypothetical protein